MYEKMVARYGHEINECLAIKGRTESINALKTPSSPKMEQSVWISFTVISSS